MFKSNHSAKILFICSLGLSLLIIVTPVSSQTLDATFGNGGKVVTQINDTSAAISVAIQSDGKIIIGGSAISGGSNYSALVRYNSDGGPDNTFGTGGTVIAQINTSSKLNSIALQSDGKIIAGGYSSHPPSSYSTFDFSSQPFTIARFNNNGKIDSMFGMNGVAKAVMTEGWGEIKKLLIKPDGKILTAGTVGTPVFENIPALVQFKPDGSLDSSFGNNGKLEGGINDIEEITDIALAKDGKIYATGQIRNWSFIGDFALLRFLPDGSLDSSFGTNGVVKTDFNGNVNDLKVENALALVILPDSSIVVTGHNLTIPATFALARYKVNGSLDSTFGTDGKVTTQMYNLNSYAYDIITDVAGGLLVSGYTSGASQDFAMARYLANGKLDSTFGNHGFVTTDFGGQDRVYASVIQSDGKIILAGQAGISSNSYGIGLARYSISALPLKLISFSANKSGENNLLQWQTAQEINLDRFEVERSLDGREFKTIGKMNAGLSNYNFTDDKPIGGKNYYRLKMIDKDGNFEYSPMRIITRHSFYVNVYPLPAKGKLNIQIKSSKTEKAEISITDVSGKILITNTLSITTGVNSSSINIQSLDKGAYFLKVITSETIETRKIIVGQ